MWSMMSASLRLTSCLILVSLCGCIIDRGALDAVDAGGPDARVMDEDARVMDRDAPVSDEDARASDEDAADRLDAGGMGAVCGDAALSAGEDCDDGNAFAGDGCSPACATESGFACSGEPSVCTTTCGDRITAGREQCDDGGLDDGDGCDASCQYETRRTFQSGPGLALAVPDNAYDGMLPSMTCVELDVRPFPLDTVTSLEVVLAMRHSWVSDLVFKLVGPGGAPVVTLMSRPGIAEPADDGTLDGGNAADFDPAFPIRFVTGAEVPAENIGNGIGNRTVCADGLCDFAPHPGAARAGDLTSFVGQPASGRWRFCVADASGGDRGQVDSVSLELALSL